MTIIKSFTKFFSKNFRFLGLSPEAFSAENEILSLEEHFKGEFCPKGAKEESFAIKNLLISYLL